MGFFSGGKYDSAKLKTQLKMAVHRFQMSSNKKTALLMQQKREIAELLSQDPPKEEKARIRAESLIREDNTIEAYEILQLSCELLSERLKLISCQAGCPPDLVGAISTLMWSSNRIDITELVEIRKQFKLKYGKKFDEDAMMNAGGVINERILVKLSVQPPSNMLVQAYLQKICEEFEVSWQPQQMDATIGVGYSVAVASGSGLGSVAPSDHSNNDDNNGDNGGGGGTGYPVVMGFQPEIPSAPSARNSAAYDLPPPAPGSVKNNRDNDNDDATNQSSYDDLNARFEQLSKK